MSRFVLVHGSWHGAWCWEKVVPLLEAAGHRAVAIDLPGHGGDLRAVAEISLDAYAECLRDAVDADPEPAVLVGHSMAGLALTHAAGCDPTGIAALVYLAAFIPEPGESVAVLANRDSASLIGPNAVPDPVHGTAELDAKVLGECFYADCSADDRARACARLRPDPLIPLVTPLPAAAPHDIPRIYVECLKDRAVTPGFQEWMYTRAGCGPVYSLDTSHSPFFSAPGELVAHLVAAAEHVTPTR